MLTIDIEIMVHAHTEGIIHVEGREGGMHVKYKQKEKRGLTKRQTYDHEDY